MSIHKRVLDLVNKNPDVRTALQRGIVNYSALARHLLDVGGFPKETTQGSIIIALQRMARNKEHVADYRQVLRRSELEIKTKMAVVIVRQGDSFSAIEKKIREDDGYFQTIQGRDVYTIITNEKYVPLIVEQYGESIVKHRSHLVLFTLVSPRNIESTPGVVSYLYSLLAVHGVNVIETMSCWTDTLFIVHKDELSRVTDLLS